MTREWRDPKEMPPHLKRLHRKQTKVMQRERDARRERGIIGRALDRVRRLWR